MVICPNCSCEKKESDFLGKENCYRCQYQKKVAIHKEKTMINCKICGKFFTKASRWVYCSWECQQKAECKQKKDYWTNHVEG